MNKKKKEGMKTLKPSKVSSLNFSFFPLFFPFFRGVLVYYRLERCWFAIANRFYFFVCFLNDFFLRGKPRRMCNERPLERNAFREKVKERGQKEDKEKIKEEATNLL